MEDNLLCEVLGCSKIALSFGIKGAVKERCCEEHIVQLISKEMLISSIAGYRSISTLEDVIVFEQRKVEATRGLGYLDVLIAQCDSEALEVGEVLDKNEKRVNAIVACSFQEIRLQVQRKLKTIKEELEALKSSFKEYLSSKTQGLVESARLLCKDLGAPLKLIRLMSEDCSTDVGKVISRSWRMSAESVDATLTYLDEKKRSDVLERLRAEVSELLKEGHFQLALQLDLYSQALGWGGDNEETRKASLNKQLEDLTTLQSLLPLAGAEIEKTLTQEVAAQCFEAGVAAKNREQFSDCVHWLRKVWNLRSGTATGRALAEGLMLGEVLGLCCGSYSEAEKVAHQCYCLEAAINPLSEEALKAIIWIAGLCYHSGRWNHAEEVCELVLSIFDSRNYSSEHFWTILLYYTSSCWYLGNGVKARNVTTEWSGKLQSDESALSEVLRLTVLAQNERGQANYAEAEKMLTSALAKQQDPASVLAAHIQRLLGLLNKDLKRLNEAEDHYKRAKELYSAKSPQCVDAANNLYNMGNLYCSLKQLDQAEKHYKLAKEVYSAVFPMSVNAAINFTRIGLLCKNSGRSIEAAEHFKCANDIYNVVSPKSVRAANNLFDTGVLYEAIGRRQEAINAFTEAQMIFSIFHSNARVKECEEYIQKLTRR